MDEDKRKATYADFNACVNLSPSEMEEWLATKKSNSVGDTHTRGGSGGESTGHKSGRRIMEFQRKKKAALTDDDYQHMRKVIGYVRRHLAQRPVNENPHGKWAIHS